PGGRVANPIPVSWQPVAGAASYQVWLTDLTTHVDYAFWRDGLTGTSVSAGALNVGDTYRVMVRAVDAAGNLGPWASGLFCAAPPLVAPATTTVSVGSSSNPATAGQAVTFTATITVNAPGTGTPTGSVTFKDGATTIATGTLSGGQATFTSSSLGVGSHSITAAYSGDANCAGSTSPILTELVNPAFVGTTAVVAASVSPAVFGQAVTFTATVTPAAPSPNTPTGTVTFKDGATTLGTGTLSGAGQASFT